MSLKQTNSLCTIPFSWEMIPGVPKCMASPAAANSEGGPYTEMTKDPPSPPPPPPGCNREPNMRRSVSSVFWREDDPFVAALKECSKDYNKVKNDKKRFGIWGSKSLLWCRCSFDVEEGNLGKRPLQSRDDPATSQERFQGLIRMHKGSRKWRK